MSRTSNLCKENGPAADIFQLMVNRTWYAIGDACHLYVYCFIECIQKSCWLSTWKCIWTVKAAGQNLFFLWALHIRWNWWIALSLKVLSDSEMLILCLLPRKVDTLLDNSRLQLHHIIILFSNNPLFESSVAVWIMFSLDRCLKCTSPPKAKAFDYMYINYTIYVYYFQIYINRRNILSIRLELMCACCDPQYQIKPHRCNVAGNPKM